MEDQSQSSDSRKRNAVTGSSRKLKDNAADWHNLILRWEKLNDEGSYLAEKIVNQRLKPSSAEAASPLPSGETPCAGRQLEQDCSKLLVVVSKMASIVSRMERLAASYRGVAELQRFQLSCEGRLTPLLHSWPTDLFVELSEDLLESYQMELRLKQSLVKELAHTGSPDTGMVYLSCWLYQPYLSPDSRLTLEALLLETGHRAL